MAVHKVINRAFDKFAAPEVHAGPYTCTSFKACGYTGYVLAIALAMTIVTCRGLSPWVIAGIVGAATITFLALAMVTKIVTGEERLVYYHHEVAVVMAAILLLHFSRQPILPYLDAAILGIGLFLACGRIGCLMAGCCHGRPNRWGVTYRAETTAAGFPQYLVGVRLFPIQAVESLWVFMIVLVGTIIFLTGSQPGEAFAWYLMSYGAGRFVFELARGDAERPYALGLSEAQWTSVLMVISIAVMERAGLFPYHTWHLGVATLLLGASAAIALIERSRRMSRHQLLDSRHVREFAYAIRKISVHPSQVSGCQSTSLTEDIYVARTSLGIQVSAGRARGVGNLTDHYSFSQQNGTMTQDTAKILADLVIQLEHLPCPHTLITGERGVFHLLVVPATVSPLTGLSPRADSVPS